MTYINLVKFDKLGYPNCEEHGAMNCVNKSRSLWRCPACNIGLDITNMFAYNERERIARLEKESSE